MQTLSRNPSLLNEPVTDIMTGARDMLPMAIAAATYGMAFGLLSVQAGFAPMQSIVMSTLVFGGSAQLVALDQFTAGVGIGAAILAGAALNMRILLITASMRDALTARPWWQIALGVYLATDASVALMQTAKKRGALASYWYLFGGGALLLGFWILATTAGAVLSRGIPDPALFGLDFAVVAVFVALLPGMWRGRPDLLPWVVSAVCVATVALSFPAQAGWAPIVGATAGAVCVGVRSNG